MILEATELSCPPLSTGQHDTCPSGPLLATVQFPFLGCLMIKQHLHRQATHLNVTLSSTLNIFAISTRSCSTGSSIHRLIPKISTFLQGLLVRSNLSCTAYYWHTWKPTQLNTYTCMTCLWEVMLLTFQKRQGAFVLVLESFKDPSCEPL